MNRSGNVALVDTGYWIALFEPRDAMHLEAIESFDLLQEIDYLIAWPVLYETLGTRWIRQRSKLERFESLLKRPNAVLLEDLPYRDSALDLTLSIVNTRYSLVDNVLRLMLDDVKLRINCFFTFNQIDFADMCSQRRIDMLPS